MSAEPATSLREQHADLTRELILKALVELLEEGGVEEISMQDVARKAGVSLRTVYRYFPTRDELILSGGTWMFSRLIAEPRVEKTLDDLVESCRIAFESWDEHPELARALASTPAGAQFRHHRRMQRFAAFERVVAEAAPELSKKEQHHAAAILGSLQGVTNWTTLRDIGLETAEATAAVEWAMRALIEDIRRRNKAARQAKRRKQ